MVRCRHCHRMWRVTFLTSLHQQEWVKHDWLFFICCLWLKQIGLILSVKRFVCFSFFWNHRLWWAIVFVRLVEQFATGGRLVKNNDYSLLTFSDHNLNVCFYWFHLSAINTTVKVCFFSNSILRTKQCVLLTLFLNFIQYGHEVVLTVFTDNIHTFLTNILIL